MNNLFKKPFLIGIIITSLSTLSCLGMQSNIIFLEDAMGRAEKTGIDAAHRVSLKEKLLAFADRSNKNLPLPRAKAYELIEEVQMQQIIDQTSEPKSVNKPLNVQHYFDADSSFKAVFAKALPQIRVLNEKIHRAVAANNDSLYLELSLEKETLETSLIERLRKASLSPWFYTGDLLWRYISIRHLEHLMMVNSVHGPLYAAFDDGTPLTQAGLKNPLVQLVSFNQVENTCGFSALANMVAVQAQVSEGQPITFDRTREIAEKAFTNTITSLPAFRKLQEKGAMKYSEDVDLIPTAVNLKLDPNTLELLSRDTIKFLHTALKSGRNIEATAHLKEKLRTLPVTHIIYNVGGGHWVLLSIVRKDGAATMFLLNSSNAPLRANDDIMQLITYVDDLLA